MKLNLQLSFGPIGWLMISEIFPLRLRGRGLSIAVLVNFAANALVTFAFSPLKVLKILSPVCIAFSSICCGLYVLLTDGLALSIICLIKTERDCNMI